jgi:Spy/CpxP family protein refolding chaperone
MARNKITDAARAANARALLARFTVDGAVDRRGFMAEMHRRADAQGIELTPEREEKLGQIIDAYERELEMQS